MSDSAYKARQAEATAIKALTDAGYEVAVPLDSTSPADLVVRNRPAGHLICGPWLAVQVKSFYQTGERDSTMTANVMRTTHRGRRPYYSDEVDSYALVNGDECLLIPKRRLDGMGRISLSSARRIAASS